MEAWRGGGGLDGRQGGYRQEWGVTGTHWRVA